MIKKFFAIVVTAALALSLAACDSGVTDGADVTTAAPAIESEPIVSGDAALGDAADVPDSEDVPAPDDAVPEVTVDSIKAGSNIIEILKNTDTVVVDATALNSDNTVYGTTHYEFYHLESGMPALQTVFTSDEVGSTESMVISEDGTAASYDVYTGYSGTVTVVPTKYYEDQIDANWAMLYPDETEVVIDAAMQDGAVVVTTFSYDETYGEAYRRGLYYLDTEGRIVYKEVTSYLVTEDAEIDPNLVYGMDTAPVMAVDTYSVSYGADRTLDLSTKQDLTEGDTCALTIHIVDADGEETQTLNVVKDAFVVVMADGAVYETFTDEAMTDVFDAEDMSGDAVEIWARSPEASAE